MSGAERVVLALGTTREAGQAAALANGANAIAPAGEDLVRIGLMADVPDQPVARRVEHRVEGNRQLDHAERGAEVAAGDGNRIDRLGAQFSGELLQLFGGQVAQIGRMPHPVEEWSLGRHAHGRSFSALLCLGVLGAHLKQQSRDILPPLPAACTATNYSTSTSPSGSIETNSPSQAHDPCMQLPRLAPAVTVADNQSRRQTCSI